LKHINKNLHITLKSTGQLQSYYHLKYKKVLCSNKNGPAERHY